MSYLIRIIFLTCLPVLAFARTEEHIDPIASVLLVVTGLFFLALAGRYLAYKLKIPRVLGELLMGVLLGNLGYFFGMQLIIVLREGAAIFAIMKNVLHGAPIDKSVTEVITSAVYASQIITALSSTHGVDYLKISYIVDIFSRYGVIFLLFMVGLESSLDELKHTGREAFIVAIIGVVAPMVLGFGVARILIPEVSYPVALFIAATLSATSIGITARVLSDMKKIATREARTILGAAMIDDVLGLIILSVVSSIVLQGSVDGFALLRIICTSLLFFFGAISLGPYVLRAAIRCFSFLDLWEVKLFISFLFVMSLAWLASLIELAAIIGAFTAGLIIHDEYFKDNDQSDRTIYQLIAPLESILAPLFFMVIGIQVKLESFYSIHVLFLATGLIIAALVGKLVSGLGANKKDDRLLVGIGMLPRGEVGLVFASIGRTLGVISDDLFSAIVLMVIITTFIAPPLLKMRYAKTGASL